MKTTENYITPSKDQPVFIVRENTGFTITKNNFKRWHIENGASGDTSSCSLSGAMEVMFDYIKTNHHMDDNIAFEIEMVDGTFNKYGDVRYYKLFSYSMRQARKHNVI